MRCLAVLLLTLLFASSIQSQDPKEKITPTPDLTAPAKVYVPTSLEDSFIELNKMLNPLLISEIKQKSERDIIFYHDNLGRWLRNNWGLWGGSRLFKYFSEKGIHHPDDMSGIILTSYWRHLNAQPIRLDEQIASTQSYYREQEEKENAVTPVSATVMSAQLKTYDGRNISLNDYKGKVVVVAWWFMLCKPNSGDCDLVSELVKLKNEFGTQGLEVIGVPGIYPFNLKRDTARVKRIVSKYKINFPLIYGDEKFTHDLEEYEKFSYSSRPQAFVISRDGYVAKRVRGFDQRELREGVMKALQQQQLK